MERGHERSIMSQTATPLLTVQACPLCESKDSSAFDTRNFRGRTVKNRLCGRCGLVFQSPRMSDKALAAFYEEEYRQLYQGDQGPGLKDLSIQRQRAQALLEFCQGSFKTVSRHLDIGCSAGLLLQRFQEAYHCQSVGVEPGKAYREYAAAQGLEIFPFLDDLEEKYKSQFDLVSLAHVLEHLPDPLAYLAGLREKWLREGGWLLVEVPNLYGHDCFETAHLVSYSPETVQRVLTQAGFSSVKVQVHGKPRSEIIPLYITILAKPSRNPPPEVQPEHGVRQKRRIAMLRRQLATRLSPKKAWLPVG
jgi:SAM-dependent methyltransferase